MHEDDRSSEGGPKSTYEVYKAEGDVLYKQGEYRKALNSYDQALELRPMDVAVLISRSQCHLQLGDSDAALADAEDTLKDDKDNVKGLLQKAEALYLKGEFENSLVCYQRGCRRRPEVQAFRLGIQKAQEAINNSIGENAGIHLEKKGDLSAFEKQDDKTKKGKFYSKPAAKKQPTERERTQRTASTVNQKTMKELLGDLFVDKQYLEEILQDVERSSRRNETNQQIGDIVTGCLNYLDKKSEFWQQQKPMYARKYSQRLRASSGREGRVKDYQQHVIRALEEIDEDLNRDRFEHSLKKSKRTLKEVESWSDGDLPNRAEVVANLHSCLGNAYLELNDFSKALDHHNIDYKIAKENDYENSLSRAMDNLGRVYARMGRYQKAIDQWQRKLPMAKSPLETTWLNHEIGRCYLELGKFAESRDHGQRALVAAEQAQDDVWALNACVLIAQSDVKSGELASSLEWFSKALDLAKLQKDKNAEAAIRRAMLEVNQRIAETRRSEDREQEEEEEEEERAGEEEQTGQDT